VQGQSHVVERLADVRKGVNRVDYVMPATWMRRARSERKEPGARPLARAVRFVMAMPIEERGRVSIWMDASPGKTWLEIEDIKEVFCRPDFPPR
jgi:hypothetical protein